MKFSGLRILFILFLLIPFLNNAVFAEEPRAYNHSAAAVSAGCLVDVAPFGIEKYYLTIQGEYSYGGTFSVGVKPLFAFRTDSQSVRLPLCLWFTFYKGNTGILFYGYGGGGAEYYIAGEHKMFSPFLTGGLKAEFNWFYVDIPAAMVFRKGNTDSDISINAGVVFKF